MLDSKFQKFIFHLTSLLTTYFPRFGAWFFNTFVPPIAGNQLLINYLNRGNAKVVQSVKKFERILVIPDIHIGDAILAQGGVQVFKDFFPNAQVDFIIKKSVACLIDGNPNVSNLFPVFTGAPFANESDLEHVKRIAAEGNYDLCYNCSPFFESTELFPKGQKILSFLTVAPQVISNDTHSTGKMHIIQNCYDLPYQLLLKDHQPQRTEKFTGVPLTLSDNAVEEAKDFLKKNNIENDKPIVFLNPDTASIYTRIPVQDQAQIIKKLVAMNCQVLLGAGFVAKNIEKELWELMNEQERANITMVPPSLALDGFSALMDFADVFISGDTGPVHMAAARKVSKSGRHNFRNKTFVITVFGATPPRLSGYDSTDPLYMPANQDVVSRTYVSESPCRNITCVNKMSKTCQNVRCYEVLDTGRMIADIQDFLNGLPKKS